MQNFFEDLEDECPWYYFDGSYKLLLGACLFVFGVFGVLLNGWLFATFIHSHLLIFKSHILVLNLCTASLGRNLIGFPFAGSSAVAKRWLFGPSCCQLFAFLNLFFGVFQMTALFVAVLERYLLAKFYRHERSLYARFYWSLVGISWFNSVIFATPPLFGYGKFSCDSTGTTCTFLWPSLTSSAKHIGFSIPYILICGVIPVIAIFYYMGKAVRLEKIFYKGEQQKEQTRLTQSIHAVCVATLALWIPAAILIGWQWLPLLIYGYRPHVPPALALIAPIASEAATSIPVLCFIAGDERLRAALLGRMRKHYALLQPERAKRYHRAYAKNAETCVWMELFINDERFTLQRGYLITGLLSLILSSWLSMTLLLTNLRFDNSYLNLANFTMVACIRRILPAFSHLPLYGYETLSCELFAFLETFLAVLEVECLTHVCIERYVIAKYITNGWPIQKNHYYLYVCLCVLFSCLYSIPPLFGFGRYGHDFQCSACTFDMVLPDTWQRYFIVTIFFLRSVKPVVVMTMMLIWARVLERKFPSSMKNQYFTRSVALITLVNLLCWTPIALIRGSVVLSYLVYMDEPPIPPVPYIMCAMWIHWVAPALTAIALFLVDDRVRGKMFNLCSGIQEVNDEKED